MSKYIPGNQKHLTLDDRRYIERALNKCGESSSKIFSATAALNNEKGD